MSKRCTALCAGLIVAAIGGVCIWLKKGENRQFDVVANKGNHAAKSFRENPAPPQKESVLLVASRDTREEELVYPAGDVNSIMAFLSKEAKAPVDLAQFEADLRRSLAGGWTPPWPNITPKLTREECVKMATPELARVCFSTGLLARAQLIYDKPIYAFSRLKILYPCYEELFKRDDLWEGVLSAYSLYASHLDPKGEPNSVMDAFMGLDNLPRMFQLPKLQEQLEGRELLFVRAQLEAIKGIRSYIEGDANESLVSSTAFFSTTTPFSIVNLTLAFMKRASVSRSASAIDTMSRMGLPQKPTMGQVKGYMDVSITEIERFLNSYQE